MPPWVLALGVYLWYRDKMATIDALIDGPNLGDGATDNKPDDSPVSADVPGKLSDHFNWSELTQNVEPVSPPADVAKGYKKLAGQLEIVRAWFGDKPVIITPHGGWHPPADSQVGDWPERGKNSRHKTPSLRAPGFESGVAADFRIPGMSAWDVYSGIKYLREQGTLPKKGGLTYYPKSGFVHYDTRDTAWDGGNSEEG